MTILKTPVSLATAFNTFQVTEILGEGGAGRVYGGTDEQGTPVAVKLLTNATSEKRRRFKNEIGFLARNQHKNIVTVSDSGFADSSSLKGPFYVMRRYAGSLRKHVEKRPTPDTAMVLFSQIIDGVEAAHLQGAVHRDLKPENVLIDPKTGAVAVADFGIASFTEDALLTLVKTSPNTRLANFQYAAPEQRTSGQAVGKPADIYALGLMLNELFTGSVPHGTSYQLIGSVAAEYAFLDGIVEAMIRQSAGQRPQTIADVKALIQKYRLEAVSLQKLREFDGVVIPAGEVSDPLAYEPPRLVGAKWTNGILFLTLDRPVNDEWMQALRNMGNYSSVWGIGPERFQFTGSEGSVHCPDNSAQAVIDHFKEWLPKVTSMLKYRLEQAAKQAEAKRRQELAAQRENEERLLKTNRSLRI